MNSKIFSKYWWVAKRLQTDQLQKSSSKNIKFSDEDFFKREIGQRGAQYFLNFYSHEGLDHALKQYGVFRKLKNIGFKNVFTVLDLSDPYKHKLTVYDSKQDSGHLLVEVVLRKEFITISSPFKTDIEDMKFHTLKIDWMCMQNPRKKFSAQKPMLPGQKYPGLGMANIAVEILMITAWRLKLAGLLNVPEHYHNALLYSKIFYYLDPEIEAKFIALKENLEGIPLHKASWGIDWGCVYDRKSGEEFEWIIDKQTVPMDVRLKKYFFESDYANYVQKRKNDFSFKFDEQKFKNFLQKKSKSMMEKQI